MSGKGGHARDIYYVAVVVAHHIGQEFLYQQEWCHKVDVEQRAKLLLRHVKYRGGISDTRVVDKNRGVAVFGSDGFCDRGNGGGIGNVNLVEDNV